MYLMEFDRFITLPDIETLKLSARDLRILRLGYEILTEEYWSAVKELKPGMINRDDIQTRLKGFFFLDQLDHLEIARELVRRNPGLNYLPVPKVCTLTDYLSEYLDKIREDTGEYIYFKQIIRRFKAADTLVDEFIDNLKHGQNFEQMLRTAIKNDPKLLVALLKGINTRDPADKSQLAELYIDDNKPVISLGIARLNVHSTRAIWDILGEIERVRKIVGSDPKKRPLLLVSWLLALDSKQNYLRERHGFTEENNVHFNTVDVNDVLRKKTKHDVVTTTNLVPGLPELLHAALFGVKMSKRNIREFIHHEKLPNVGYALIPYNVFFKR